MATGLEPGSATDCQVAPAMSLSLSPSVSSWLFSALRGLGSLGKGQPSPGWAREAPAFRCFNNRSH